MNIKSNMPDKAEPILGCLADGGIDGPTDGVGVIGPIVPESNTLDPPAGLSASRGTI